MYIINPWIFYLVDLFDSLKVFSVLFMIAFVICGFCYVGVWVAAHDDEPEEELQKWSPKVMFAKIKFLVILSILIIVFVPSKETCYQMLIASQVTVEHINDAKQTVQNVADYIVEAAKEVQAGGEDE